jgi:VIT1/CCC1 family predicted Fe2+/Mn2+ transporter
MIARAESHPPGPVIVHTAVGYAAGLLFPLAPFLFGFDSETAKWTSIGSE